MAIFLLSACGEKKITVKGADGTEYESYQECCAAQDFQAAHQYLAKLKNSEIGGYYDAKEYVFKQEALYLMSIGDETAKKRVIYLLKEEGRNNNYVEMLIDLAIENDDEAFVKTLTNQFVEGASTESIKKVTTYLFEKSQEENITFVKNLLARLGDNNLLFDLAIKIKDEDLIITSLINQLKNGLTDDNFDKYLPILTKFPKPEVANLVLAYLSSKKKEMRKGTPDGTIMKEEKRRYDEQFKAEVANNKDFHEMAIDEANEFNELCDRALYSAIENKNLYLANKIVDIYAPVPCAWIEGRRVTYNNNAKVSAKNRIRSSGL